MSEIITFGRKILSSLILAGTLALSLPLGTYAVVEVQKGNLVELWIFVAIALFIIASKRVILQLTPNWPKWMH